VLPPLSRAVGPETLGHPGRPARQPGGVLLRLAMPDDALEVAQVHVRSWQVGYRGLLADDVLDRLEPEAWAPRYTFGSTDPAAPDTVLAVEDEAIVGFASTAPARDDDARGCGELCALYVDPPAWDIGAGRALIADARQRMVARGYVAAVLYVLQGNERAERFYRLDGWQADGIEKVETVIGLTLPERRYRRALP
jgi:GNAT superfamily N-acetyltransferase